MVVTESAPATVPASPPRRSRIRGRLFYALALGVGIWALVLFIADLPSKSPVFATVPTHPARASTVGGYCHATDGLGNPEIRRDRVWVDAAPSGAIAVWLPGTWFRPCTSVVTRLDAGQAQALAAAVRSAQPPTGVSACPADTGASVTIFLTYPGKAKAEVIRMSLSGCAVMTAPGRDVHSIPAGGYAALRPVPTPWSNYTG